MEIRFPPQTKYPYEAPFIFLKTTCHDIPRDVLLRISRRLYREACDICKDGMPCIYTVSELLQMDENMSACIQEDNESFPAPNFSLFHMPDGESKYNDLTNTPNGQLPTHYEKGQTFHDGSMQRNAAQVS